MSYRCDICRGIAPHGRVQLRHKLYRDDGSIRTEIPCCEGCFGLLSAGVPLMTVIKDRSTRTHVTVEEVKTRKAPEVPTIPETPQPLFNLAVDNTGRLAIAEKPKRTRKAPTPVTVLGQRKLKEVASNGKTRKPSKSK